MVSASDTCVLYCVGIAFTKPKTNGIDSALIILYFHRSSFPQQIPRCVLCCCYWCRLLRSAIKVHWCTFRGRAVRQLVAGMRGEAVRSGVPLEAHATSMTFTGAAVEDSVPRAKKLQMDSFQSGFLLSFLRWNWAFNKAVKSYFQAPEKVQNSRC